MSNTKIAVVLLVAGALVYLALEYLAKEVKAATIQPENDWSNESNP